MNCFVTGGAGFIGSNLTDRLLKDQRNRVVVYDNFSTGRRRFLESAMQQPNFELIEGDVLDQKKLTDAMRSSDIVYHLSANADVSQGPFHTRRDLEQNTIATYNVLEAMRVNHVERIAFSSTGSVYGESAVIPTPEDAPFPVQTSLYGASKLACEGLIAAFSEAFGITCYIFRFVSILGERYTHGHVYDFCRRLRQNPDALHILGDGRQTKSYLYVGDCMSAMERAMERPHGRVNIYNLGTDQHCTVNDSASWIASRMGLAPAFSHAGGARGWVGDNPFLFLDTKKIRSLGWTPALSIREGVEKTVDYLLANPWVFGEDGK